MKGENASVATTFDRARRRSAYRRLARVVRRQDDTDLLPLEEAAKRVELIHAEQERIFMEESGLGSARPEARILRFSRPAGYLELLENVQIHGYHLMLDAGPRARPRGDR